MVTRSIHEQFGGYLLLEQIGIGGMAEVFLARHSGLAGFEKDIVIKRIRPHLSEAPSFVNMFLAEAKLAAQLSHPHIVQIYDLGRISDSFFIAMEYIAGRDMSAVIPKCKELSIPFPVEYALKISSNVCEALSYAHSKADNYGSPLHIVHRDVSPENIRVAWTGSVKILDFGIAKAATQMHETKPGEIKGKLSYMSPEQVMGKDIDHRSDIFSLGVVLYESLTGLKLFSGQTDMAIMQNIVDGKIYPPSYYRDDVPRDVEAIIMKALEKDCRKRYQSSADMQFDIDSFLAGHEFTPTNIHLSNFLKQLFKTEIEEEKKRRQRYRAESSVAAPPPSGDKRQATWSGPAGSAQPPPPPPDASGSVSDVHEVAQEEWAVEHTGNSVLVSLEPADLAQLRTIAARREVTPEVIIREMVANYLCYHD